MTDVVMPRLSDTMEEGTILRWLKQDGEQVARGEELVEIETDKATMTYESDRQGTLRTVAREGDTLAVGELIARIGEGATVEASDVSEEGTPEPAASPAAPTVVTPNGAPAQSPTRADGERVKASPLARRVARESGVDLAAVHGTGPGGRIVKADVEGQTGATPAEPATLAEPAPSPVSDVAAAKGETTAVELTRTQRTIARRMAESKATIPDFTLTAAVDMRECVELRAELGRLARKSVERAVADDEGVGVAKGGVAPTYNDMIVKACALALREHPRANGSYRDGRFELHSRVNVGVAVAVTSDDPTGGALVVPTVFDADTKALGEIARETRSLAQRVRDGQVTPPELGGATFTVSNLGMYGIRHFSAIVNPPQAAILAVGAVAPRPVARKNKAIVRPAMTLTLSCDHRILYGADAALFLTRVRELLEEPAALTL
ncbi:MAG TPA: dihydrolipoamide acetyltransferase family protein [Solirubrobacteraceae bacterium]|nr:dihydrolipoamide acetyltransferase family protein [Solirubrobacteraceae bacterium]